VPRVHYIDDYSDPQLPFPIRAVNALGGSFARSRVRLDEAGLIAAAQRETGLSDFGDGSFREPLRVLLSALDDEAGLTFIGRFIARRLVLQLLITRLRVQDLLRRHSEILSLEVASPIVIMGLPRTGTSHLHSLIAQDPGLRSLPYWESLEPLPPSGYEPRPGAPDPRIKRCERALRLIHYAMPLFPLMHELTPEALHEEIQLLAVDFSTMLFEWNYQVPSYRDWYLASDQTGAYRYLRVMLQVLQWLRGGKRWVLKTPQHIEQIRPLLNVFPDVKVIQTHRDPVRVTASFCTMYAYAQRLHTGSVDAVRIGRYWADRIERMLNASVDDRHLIPDDQVFDVRFHEFMADDMAMVERVLEFAEQPLTDAARRAIRSHMKANPRGKHGTVRYRLEDFGIDPSERRKALRRYRERFEVPDEEE
jgi:hypothetical protein